MKSAQKFGVVALLMLTLTGCRHTKTTQLAPAQAPSINTKPVAAPPSGNPLTAQSQLPLPSLPPATEDASKHAPKPPPKVHHRRKPKPLTTPATTPDATTAAAVTPSPANPAPAPAVVPPIETAEVTPPVPPASIGLLSTGDVTAGAQTRQSTLDLISNTESGLKNIKRMLESATDQQTASQIRAFLQKAKAALELNDLDGAHTLATKAKVLLDELTKP